MANVIQIVIRQSGEGSAIVDANKALGGMKGVGDTAISTLLGVGKALTGVGAIAATALIGFAASGVKAAMDVDHQLAQIAATLGTTKDAAMPLKDLMTELALDPKLTVNATQAGEAIEVLAANGLGLEDILAGGAKGAVQLANATGSDFATAATIATDAMQQFGFEANQLETVADGIAGVLVKSKFDANDYALALSNAGGIAGSLGVDFGDFNTVLAGTSSFFSSGSDAGTSFKTLLTRLAKPTDDVKDAMEEYGLSIFDAKGEMKPFSEITGQLNDVFKDLNEAEKAELATRLGGTDAMRTVLGLAGLTEDQFLNLSKEVNKSGLASQAAATRVDSLTGAWEIFKGIIEAVQIQVGDKFLPIIRRVTEAVSVWASENSGQVVAFFGVIASGIDSVITKGTELFNAFQTGGATGLMAALGLSPEQIAMIESGVALIMDNLEIFKGALIGIGAVVGVGIFASLAAGFIALLTPINLLIAGAALLGAAWVGNWGNIQGITMQVVSVLTTVFNTLSAVVMSVVNAVVANVLPQLQEAFINITAALNNMGLNWGDVWNALVTATTVVASVIGLAILGIVGTVTGLVTGFASAFATVTSYFTDFQNAIGTFVSGITTLFTGMVTITAGLITGDLGMIFDGLQQTITGVFDTISGLGDIVLTGLQAGFATVLSFTKGFMSSFLGFFDTLAPSLGVKFENAWKAIREVWKPDIWLELGASIIEGILEGIKTNQAEVLEMLKSLAGDALQAAKTAIGFGSPAREFIPLGESISQGLAVGINSAAGLATQAIEGMGRNLLTSTSSALSFIDDLDMGGLARGFGTGGGQWRNFRNILKNEIMGGMGALADGTADVMDSVYKVAARFNFPPGMAAEFAEANGLVEHLTGNFEKFRQQMNIENLGNMTQMAASFSGLGGTFADMLTQQMAGGEGAIKTMEAYRKLTGEIGSQETQMATLQEELEALNAATERDTAAIEKKQKAIEKLTGEMEKNQKAIVATSENYAALQAQAFDLFSGSQTEAQRVGSELATIALLEDFLRSGDSSFLIPSDAVSQAAGITGILYDQISGQAELNRLVAEQAEREALITEQKEAQQKLDFLKSQLDLLKLGQSLGGDIFQGITFGLNASVEDMLAAVNAVTMAMVDQIDHDLGIASPSKLLFDKFKNQIGGAMVGGLLAVKPMMEGAIQPILNPIMQGANAAGKVVNNYFNQTVNTRADSSSVIGDFRTMQLMAG